MREYQFGGELSWSDLETSHLSIKKRRAEKKKK